MSTPTTIEAHIASEVIDNQRGGIAISDLKWFSRIAPGDDGQAEDNPPHDERRTAGSAARALTVEDFGGRSDAPGG